MPWKPIDPARAERERIRRRAMEAARPRGHNRAYKKAAWLKLRVEKLGADPRCEFCHEAPATEVDHINGDAWDNRWVKSAKRVQAVSFLPDDARVSRPGPLGVRLAETASPVSCGTRSPRSEEPSSSY